MNTTSDVVEQIHAKFAETLKQKGLTAAQVDALQTLVGENKTKKPEHVLSALSTAEGAEQ